MWRTSTRVLQITACLLAVCCFVFVRTTSLGVHGGESAVKACGEIFHVCISGSPEVLLESKPHKVSRLDSPIGSRILLKSEVEITRRLEQTQCLRQASILARKQPLWLLNKALLI
ncbi:MAG: hypothetical protein K2Y39_10350 [Candidatus Obscuribacterales bacterium]|nr:hypothetical protein [Candidatus Obscuribacterales bacterium]